MQTTYNNYNNDPIAHRRVGFFDALALFFENYVNFVGRSSRGAYWWAWLGTTILSVILIVVDVNLFPEAFFNGSFLTFSNVFAWACIIPGLSLSVRRLHDVGRSGFWLFLIITIIGIIPILFWYCQPGIRAECKYGPDVEAGD